MRRGFRVGCAAAVVSTLALVACREEPAARAPAAPRSTTTHAEATASPTEATPPPEAWRGVSGLPTGVDAVEAFNTYVDGAQPGWATDPLRTGIEFLGFTFGTEVDETTLLLETPIESDGEARLTVTEDGLADDSVRAHRYRIDLARNEASSWRVLRFSKTQRCWPERGHGDFSTDPCI